MNQFEKGMPNAADKLNENFNELQEVIKNAQSVKKITLPKMNGASRDLDIYIYNDRIVTLTIDGFFFPKGANFLYKIPTNYAPQASVSIPNYRNDAGTVGPAVLRINTDGSIQTLGNYNDTSGVFGSTGYMLIKTEA